MNIGIVQFCKMVNIGHGADESATQSFHIRNQAATTVNGVNSMSNAVKLVLVMPFLFILIAFIHRRTKRIRRHRETN